MEPEIIPYQPAVPRAQAAYDVAPSEREGLLHHALTIAFRHRRILITGTIAVVVATILAMIFTPYRSQMSILVKHERIDAMVTPDDTNRMLPPRDQAVNEADLNSEVELLQSHDLLEKVVLASGLYDPKDPPFTLRRLIPWRDKSLDQPKAIARAVEKLGQHLDVKPVRMTNLISISYKNLDAEQAGKVLKSLAALYMEKHVAVHQSPAGPQFFMEQKRQYQQKLADAENNLKKFGNEMAVNPLQERDIVVAKMSEFKADLQNTDGSIRSTQTRIQDLKRQLATVTPRQTTVLRTVQNPQLEQTLRGTLLDLELKRTDLLQKYQPTYRSVQEVEAQIKQATTALDEMHRNPMKEDTTDVDPVYQWVKSELSKAEADLTALQARKSAIQASVATYEDRARNLDNLALQQTDLQREAKAQEANYLLYVQKTEEARINQELDRNRVVNVALAEEPTVPVLPAYPRLLWGALFGVLVALFWAGVLWMRDRLDTSLRTPNELQQLLGVPVLAALPSRTA